MEKFEINSRIKQLIDYLHVSQNEFAKEIGISTSRMSNILTYRNRPDSELLQLIIFRYRNVNADWLLTGIGEIELKQKNLTAEFNKKSPSVNTELIHYMREKDEKIECLIKKISKLEYEIADLKKKSCNIAPDTDSNS